MPELKSSLATIQKTADEIITGIEEHFAELAMDKTVTKEYDHGFTELSEEEAAENAKIFEHEHVDKPVIEKAVADDTDHITVAEKTQTVVANEKTIKAAVMDALKERIAYSNDGMLSTYKMSEQSHRVLWDNKIKIDDKTVTQDGKPMFKINRRFSSRKTKDCYRELTPTLEYIGDKQQKPSIRRQLAETKVKSASTKAAPEKKKEDLSL